MSACDYIVIASPSDFAGILTSHSDPGSSLKIVRWQLDFAASFSVTSKCRFNDCNWDATTLATFSYA